MKKCIAYIDILGSKNSFLGENPNQGIQKIEYLIQIIEEQLRENRVSACFSDIEKKTEGQIFNIDK